MGLVSYNWCSGFVLLLISAYGSKCAISMRSYLVKNRYRFELPYTSHLERLCHQYHYQPQDRESYVQSIITASIGNGGGLILLVTSRVQLLNGWDENLIDRKSVSTTCVCFPFPGQNISGTPSLPSKLSRWTAVR